MCYLAEVAPGGTNINTGREGARPSPPFDCIYLSDSYPSRGCRDTLVSSCRKICRLAAPCLNNVLTIDVAQGKRCSWLQAMSAPLGIHGRLQLDHEGIEQVLEFQLPGGWHAREQPLCWLWSHHDASKMGLQRVSLSCDYLQYARSRCKTAKQSHGRWSFHGSSLQQQSNRARQTAHAA